MPITSEMLGTVAQLGAARDLAHALVQPLTRAARANLPQRADDSHSNLARSVEHQAFLTHPLGKGADCLVGLTLHPLSLFLTRDAARVAELPLEGKALSDVGAWLDGHLKQHGLIASADITLPYDLPNAVAGIEQVPIAPLPGLAPLAAWYSLASGALGAVATDLAAIKPGPSPVRCWPHHFDIATYIALEAGDPETARGIGVGMSPGDETNDQPYFYVNPWPMPDPATLPAEISPGYWHKAGFVGSVVTAEAITDLQSIEADMRSFLSGSISACRRILDA